MLKCKTSPKKIVNINKSEISIVPTTLVQVTNPNIK